MPPSLEDRRRAVAEALRALASEDAVTDGVETRLDVLSAKISEVLARLDSVETTLLEAAWERPAATTHVAGDVEAEPDAEERVSVPRVPLGEGRMSRVAAEALFGA